MCWAQVSSSSNSHCRRPKLRQNWLEDNITEFKRLIIDELDILNGVLPWVERDPRQGFHIEPGGTMFNAAMIRNKIKALETQLKKLR